MAEKSNENYFKLINVANYVVLKLTGEHVDTQVEHYLKEVLPTIEKTGLDLIVNCEHFTNFEHAWAHALTVTEQTIRKNKKNLRLILVSREIKNMISQKGLSGIMKININLRDALISLGLVNKNSLDVGFVNPFLEAALLVFKVQMQINASAGKIFIKKQTDVMSGDISGVIGLVSDTFTGNVIITFPEKTFLPLMSKMHGEEYKTINNENADGVSEFTNMIFGQAKISLNDQGYGIKTALPSLIIGKNHRFSSNKQGLIVVVPFESDIGSFFVEVSLVDN